MKMIVMKITREWSWSQSQWPWLCSQWPLKSFACFFFIGFIFTFLSLTSTHQTTEKNFLPLVSFVNTGNWCYFSHVKSYWILVGSMIQCQCISLKFPLFQTGFIIRAWYIQVLENHWKAYTCGFFFFAL